MLQSNDTDAEGDIDRHSVHVVVAASVGTVWVSSAAGSGAATVSYAASGAGYDAVIYEICDRARQCSTAEVTFIVGADT